MAKYLSDKEIRLIGLVRLLEEGGHLFAADPAVLTNALRRESGTDAEKLLRRAEMADRDHRLRDALERSGQGVRLSVNILTLVWLLLGFGSAAALLSASGVNFFIVLAGVLGTNTLMFALWLLFLPYTGKSLPFWFNFGALAKRRDKISSALLRLYSAEWRSGRHKWYLASLTHRFWLASLSGILAAVVLLLSLRQYTFNWESTLLSDGLFVQAVRYLGALPALLGFPVPDSEAVLGSRLQHNPAAAREWGGLLVGSIAAYGLIPRFLVWLLCRTAAARQRLDLPLAEPYYQNILRVWQTEIVDADRVRERLTARFEPFAANPAARKYAVLLERPWPDARWHVSVLAQTWNDCGVAANRDDITVLAERLQAEPSQLLIGVQARMLPDRGLMRQIVRLAEAASGGTAVQLLADGGSSEDESHSEQWRQALAELGLTCLYPPERAQVRSRAV
ncbi:MAG: DUF2868 domain-containing protein [Neisseria sp.]|nr:DUF2868 domain-containing protein [Neisseria sp.]